MTLNLDPLAERVLILAPVGRDAALARTTLEEAGITSFICVDIDEVCQELPRGVGALLFTQEALPAPSAVQLLDALRDQPPWSDPPLVVLLSGGEVTATVARLLARIGQSANATFVERPVRATTLVGTVRAALRARHRQYEFADLLQKHALAEVAERQARTAAEDAIRTRDDLLASVAHDLKNPLGSIKGYAQLLRRQASRTSTPESGKLAEGLGRIDAMVTRAVTQIDELLDVARLQAGHSLSLTPEPTELVALVRSVVSEFEQTLATGRIQVDVDADAINGIWDPLRLERMLGNLLSNAIKYSPPERPITIVVRRENEQGETWARVDVQDQGIGIPAADLPYVFERFHRASNVAGFAPGTGLGLAGARQIVEQHGGTIGVVSEEGRGTTFTVRLPLVHPDEASAEPLTIPGAFGADH